MVDNETLDDWFCREVLPLERPLMQFIRRNWRVADDVVDLRNDVYELSFSGARRELPANTRQYVFTVARNHLINMAKRAKIVSFDLVADLETVDHSIDFMAAERHLAARESLRHFMAGLEKLTPRLRQIVELRKIEGLDPQETADRLGIARTSVNVQLTMAMKAIADHMLGGRGRVIRPRYLRRRDERTS